MATPKPPRLLLALPYPALVTSVTATVFTLLSGNGPLLPSQYLIGLAPRVFFQLAAFVNPGTGSVIELAVSLQSDDATRFDLLPETALRTAIPGWSKQLSRMSEISTRLKRETILAPRLFGRVDSGSGAFACPTLLVLREG